jgi:hypothetical protein
VTSAGRRWIGPLACAIAGVAMLAWTWRRWPDVLVDFGGELFVPWRLSQGDVLYRDVAYFTGPLSPYFNALLFKVCGASFLTLACANLAILALIAAALFRLLESVSDRAGATIGTLVFLVLFAFAQLEIYGNSNYVTPYAHETTHGTLLALGALLALARWLRTGNLRWLAAAGFCLGLVFLTKVEYFLAAAVACVAIVALASWRDRARRAAVAKCAALFAGAAVLAPLVAFLVLCTAMSAGDALHGTLGAWPYVTDARITSLPFYTHLMGTDRTLENGRAMLSWLVPYAVVLVPALGLALLLRRRGSGGPWRSLASFAAAAALVATLQNDPRVWLEAFRPLPLFVALALVASALAFARHRGGPGDPGARGDRHAAARAILAIGVSAYALVLIGKIVLNARLQMYGYALAMPAMLVFCVALVSWIPRAIDARGGDGGVFRGAALGLLAIATASQLWIMRGYFADKTVAVGTGSDAFLADARGNFVNATLAVLEQRARSDDRLAVLPEGVMINYLLRRRTPARYINYMPPELLMFGEERILADFAARPPEWIVLAHKPTAEYGLPFFGQDYGRELFAWIREHYAVAAAFGGPPLQRGTLFGIEILRRKT